MLASGHFFVFFFKSFDAHAYKKLKNKQRVQTNTQDLNLNWTRNITFYPSWHRKTD